MKELFLEMIASHIFWIAVELLVIAILAFFIIKNTKRKKTIKEDLEHIYRDSQYRELDKMLVNKKRERR